MIKGIYSQTVFLLRPRILLSEFIGTMFLLIGVIGSGIMAEKLSPSDVGLQLLQNAAATTGVLIAVISIFATISADFNPAQIIGGCTGTIVANIMFDLDWFQLSQKNRSGAELWLAEIIATLGLLLIVFSLLRTKRPNHIPYVVGAYIGGAYYFTSSTSFANPAVSVARMLSDTFAGIKPSSAPMFILMQLLGLGLAVCIIRYLFSKPQTD